jgi:hypothetical protein
MIMLFYNVFDALEFGTIRKSIEIRIFFSSINGISEQKKSFAVLC